MKRHLNGIWERLTYANVVATIALVAALGTGGAYAASQLAKNSVGKKSIRKGAVGTRALQNGGVTSRDLAKTLRARTESVQRANVSSDGSLAGGNASGASLSAPNTYRVTFKRSVAGCTYAATPALTGTGNPASGSVTISGSGGREVTVTTFDATGDAVASGFHLIAAC